MLSVLGKQRKPGRVDTPLLRERMLLLYSEGETGILLRLIERHDHFWTTLCRNITEQTFIFMLKGLAVLGSRQKKQSKRKKTTLFRIKNYHEKMWQIANFSGMPNFVPLFLKLSEENKRLHWGEICHIYKLGINKEI